MTQNFIFLPSPKLAVEDVSPAAQAAKWFASVRRISLRTLVRLREAVRQKLETGACRHMVPDAARDTDPGIELVYCVETLLQEQWNSLSPEERLLIRWPTIDWTVGETWDLPRHGKALLIARQLTQWFTVEMVFRLPDGSHLTWHFRD
jgi:hypothetical protein